jgi:hypothetical protein
VDQHLAVDVDAVSVAVRRGVAVVVDRRSDLAADQAVIDHGDELVALGVEIDARAVAADDLAAGVVGDGSGALACEAVLGADDLAALLVVDGTAEILEVDAVAIGIMVRIDRFDAAVIGDGRAGARADRVGRVREHVAIIGDADHVGRRGQVGEVDRLAGAAIDGAAVLDGDDRAGGVVVGIGADLDAVVGADDPAVLLIDQREGLQALDIVLVVEIDRLVLVVAFDRAGIGDEDVAAAEADRVIVLGDDPAAIGDRDLRGAGGLVEIERLAIGGDVAGIGDGQLAAGELVIDAEAVVAGGDGAVVLEGEPAVHRPGGVDAAAGAKKRAVIDDGDVVGIGGVAVPLDRGVGGDIERAALLDPAGADTIDGLLCVLRRAARHREGLGLGGQRRRQESGGGEQRGAAHRRQMTVHADIPNPGPG